MHSRPPKKDTDPPLLDARQLRTAGRNFSGPFRIRLVNDQGVSELLCRQIVRIIPGKRLVGIGSWERHPVVAKFFLDRLKSRYHAHHEQQGVAALEKAGIATPPILWRGALGSGLVSIIIYRQLEGAREFNQVWQHIKNGRKRTTLLEKVLVVIADMHSAGLRQKDLHLNNFLIVGQTIYTIDTSGLDTRRQGQPLAKALCLQNLGLFFAQLPPIFDGLIPMVIKAYTAKRKWSIDPRLLDHLMDCIRQQRKKRQKMILKKIFRESTAYVCLKSAKCFMIYDRQMEGTALMDLLENLDRHIQDSPLLKDGNTCTVARVDLDGKSLVVKRYNIKSTWHGIKRALRATRAWRTWRNAHRLMLLGISTPRPIALLEKRRGPLRSTAYYVSEFVTGPDVYHLMHSERRQEVDQTALADFFVRLIEQLAEDRISHGDLKATNFIVGPKALYVVDLDAMREYRSRWRFVQALRKDCRRLMKNWSDLPDTAGVFDARLKAVERFLI
jgi:tRNA A-37 threonylcarbamoyl transferase component Bud32